MYLFGKYFWDKCSRRKSRIPLTVEALEDRAVPSVMIAAAGPHMAASAMLTDKTAVMATMPGPMQIIDRAPAAAQSAGQLSHSGNSQANSATGNSAGMVAAMDNAAASDEAWIDSLMQQYSAAQGANGKDRLGMLIESDGPTSGSLTERIFGQAQQEMKALRDTLAADGVSQHDLDQLFGRDNTGDMTMVVANLGRQDEAPGFLSQLPFLSVTQGQDPIQAGAAHAGIDPRAAEDGDGSSSNSRSSSMIADAQSTKGDDGSTNVTVHYKDGSQVQVILPQGSSAATSIAPDGVQVISTVSDGMIKAVTAVFGDGSAATVIWGKGATNSGSMETIDWLQNGDGIARLHEGDLLSNVVNVGHVLHTGGTVWVIDPKTSMPNPDADNSPPAKPIAGVSGDTGVTPVGVGGAVDPMTEEIVHTVDIDKLARGIVTHTMSTVNPNPNGPSVGGDAGGGLPGYHGPVDYDNAHNIANVHPGGKPTIILGPPSPKGSI